MKKFIHGLALAIAVLVAIAVGLVAVLYLGFSAKEQWDNYFFARNQFKSDDIEITRIIGSKRWFGSEAYGCTYAVVEISEASSQALVDRRSSGKVQSSNYDSSRFSLWLSERVWIPTPISKKSFGQFEGSGCTNEFESADKATIERGLDSEGGLFAVSRETLDFILPNQRIVGTIRFSD